MIESTVRILKYTIQHIVRNPWQSMAVTLILAVTFLIAQLFFVVSLTSDRVLTYLENQPQVTVFFKNEAQEDQILQIKRELEKDEVIQEVTYISKEQAVEIYKSRYEDQPELLEFVTPDILPASLEIASSDVTHLSEVADMFRDNQFVETVLFQQDLVDEILRWTNAIRRVGIVLFAVHTFITVTLIWVVISNTIGSFSKEIEIMRLVGAGSWYVRWPFLLDAALFSLVATILSTTALYYSLPYIEEVVKSFVAVVDVVPKDPMFITQLGGVTFGLGALFTMLISLGAIWSYSRR